MTARANIPTDRHADAEPRESQGGETSSAPMTYRFKSGGDNHIVARFFDGVNEGPDERIALPFHLQKQLVGSGYTYTNFQTRSHDIEGGEQTIEPGYVVDGLILVSLVRGSTGVTLTGPDEDLRLIEITPHFWRETC